MVTRALAARLVSAWTDVVAMAPVQATAADIKLLGSAGIRVALTELLPQFEKSSGNKVSVEYGTLGANKDRVMNGEAVDVVMVTPAQKEELEKGGKLLAGSGATLGRAGYGVLVKASATKPDLGTVDAFKRTMLAAK